MGAPVFGAAASKRNEGASPWAPLFSALRPINGMRGRPSVGAPVFGGATCKRNEGRPSVGAPVFGAAASKRNEGAPPWALLFSAVRRVNGMRGAHGGTLLQN